MLPYRYRILFSGFAFCLAWPFLANAGEAENLRDLVLENHRASREFIRTCSCRVEFNSTTAAKTPDAKPTTESLSAQFWYSPTSVRGKITEHGTFTDFVWNASVKQTLATRINETNRKGASRAQSPKHMPRADAYVRGLLVLNIPGTIKYEPFEGLLAKATRFLGARKTKREGRELITVRLQFDKPAKEKKGESWTAEISFDPAVNYLVRFTKYTSESNYVREAEVVSFQEFAPGVFFPVELKGRSGIGEKFHLHYKTTLSDVRINQRIPENIFKLQYPTGVLMNDEIRGTRFKADSSGNPISVAKPIKPKPKLITNEPPSPYHTATEEEPSPSYSWVLTVSMGILMVGLAVAIVRRVRGKGSRG